MKLPDFSTFAPFKELRTKMGIPADRTEPRSDEVRVETFYPMLPRAVVMFRSGAKLDLLDPQPDCWSDEDLAQNLARIARWGGATKWEFSLSVAQHSLMVLAIAGANAVLTPRQALRELLHDASEGLLGWDPIAPLKPELGTRFRNLEDRLQNAIARRYDLGCWSRETYARHKHADRLAAASEAFHVVGWTLDDMRDVLNIELAPLSDCPLAAPEGFAAWQPWPPALTERLFLHKLNLLKQQATAAS
ncbi:phosphohydrolase [uncultured Rhodoblastus sp.]|uniref:phosphohydrolase n=1 Tax=uncultured Rhodoblastus sp. TaxID=543037 RepID=UPI0025CC4BA0|nr:phosphohydrolase [uncultured Rhodoblastus sp.]